MVEDIISAIPLGFVIAFLIGPVFFALLETSAIKGFRAALAFDIGVIVADIIFLMVAYFMTSSILEKLKDDPSLFVFGGGILAAYGVISFAQTRKSYLKEVDPNVLIVQNNNYLKLAIKGFLLNFINVGVLGFWLGLIVVFSPQMEGDGNRILIFFSTTLLVYFIVDIFKIMLAKSLNRYLTPLRIFWLKRLIAIIMMVCGAVLIFKGLFPETSEQFEERIHIMPELVDPTDAESYQDSLLKVIEEERKRKQTPVRQVPKKDPITVPDFDPSKQTNKPEIDTQEDSLLKLIDSTMQNP
ncbi:Threonine/homoserine/homoserine lactone efflux protein [Nonlabens sp. Hel1_33_55]|uniref:LysE family translocator n=1 Tax=Nonlabens sp. Hel1_33_55 TaxID=1336802 RepID=UPI000875BF80|nr:LysE family translocator [Nonlabens sp. Hel1_33_55]SCY33493.1 Threonine/homoserine/homoserine lactone efflux protein [Nonlabens sp. Hel1_33_55]